MTVAEAHQAALMGAKLKAFKFVEVLVRIRHDGFDNEQLIVINNFPIGVWLQHEYCVRVRYQNQ